MVWVVLGHTYSYAQTALPDINLTEVNTELPESFLFRCIR